MKCGVRFCGGCNPRYDRGRAYEQIKNRLNDIEFEIASEGEEYDHILVIGGCTNCCASYDQYTYRGQVNKMWAQEHIEKIINELNEKLV